MHSRRYPSYRGAHANRSRMTESSERCLRAERGGKRLWLTRRRRLRTGREATLRSDEHRATGAASESTGQPGRRAEAASVHRVAGLPEATGSEAPAKATGAPQLRPRSAVGGAIGDRHGQPGQRERRQASGPGNRSRVQLRERRSGNRPDRVGGHRRRATGGGAIGNGAGQPATGPQRASPAEPSGTTGDV